jgi:hypothetical protein
LEDFRHAGQRRQVGGYGGGAIWDHPAIDPKRVLLYVGTGNNYTAPAAVEACQDATPTAQCASPDDHFDSVNGIGLEDRADQVGRRVASL